MYDDNTDDWDGQDFLEFFESVGGQRYEIEGITVIAFDWTDETLETSQEISIDNAESFPTGVDAPPSHLDDPPLPSGRSTGHGL